MTKHDILLDVQHLSHVFPLTKQVSVKALDDISFQIHRGEIFGLVGESGSGKSTAARGAGGAGVSGGSGCSTGGCTEGSSADFFPPQAVRVSSSSAITNGSARQNSFRFSILKCSPSK